MASLESTAWVGDWAWSVPLIMANLLIRVVGFNLIGAFANPACARFGARFAGGGYGRFGGAGFGFGDDSFAGWDQYHCSWSQQNMYNANQTRYNEA